MSQEKASLLETISIAVKATRYAMARYDDAGWGNDRPPMDLIEKVAFLATNLRPDWLRQQVQILSSENYGRHVLEQVFPRYDNPEDFHSTEWEIRLDEHPVQVLGWAEQQQLVQEGVEMGLDEMWIDRGFVLQSGERGIDLEWHFYQHPPRCGDEQTSELGGLLGF